MAALSKPAPPARRSRRLTLAAALSVAGRAQRRSPAFVATPGAAAEALAGSAGRLARADPRARVAHSASRGPSSARDSSWDLLRSSLGGVTAACAAAVLLLSPAAAEAQLVASPADLAPTEQAERESNEITYSQMLKLVETGAVDRVDLYGYGRRAVATLNPTSGAIKQGGRKVACDLPAVHAYFINTLLANGIDLDVHMPRHLTPEEQVVLDVLPPVLFLLGVELAKQIARGGVPGLSSIPGMKKDVKVASEVAVRFNDVAGIEEAKEELSEVVDFLKAPERFVKVGAKIPKGVLLTGPPGTGKTLMAKALAGESGVPFIQASASEFIELFVGVGASRVREIFKRAKERAPCIVFIDEIDAIGGKRGTGRGGGADEREQTLNQILTEMDGFEGNSGVIVVAATNRSEILDSALLRPGRFDRRVQVDLPDAKGREQILKVHLRNKRLEGDVRLPDVAKRSAGMSGADLENLMNESAILAARRRKSAISAKDIEDATDRVLAGLEGKPLAKSSERRILAYHEAGKALVATLLPHHDPVSKVTLIPRGQQKSLTWFSPDQDQSLVSAASLKSRIAALLGGRAAEQVVLGNKHVTTQAAQDLQRADKIARAMVTQVGMSSVGQIAIDQGGLRPSYSEELACRIDEAIGSLCDEGYLAALKLIVNNRDCLDKIAHELCEREWLNGNEVEAIVEEFTRVPEKLAAV